MAFNADSMIAAFMKGIWTAVSILAACSAACSRAEEGGEVLSSSPKDGPPDILLIVADDLGWGDVGFRQGGIDTPNIDRLAREGTTLDRFYAFPVCSPSRAALLTGRSPMRYGFLQGPIKDWNKRRNLPLDEVLLPELLHRAGYATSMIGKWHLGTQKKWWPQARGFDHFYGHLNGMIDYYTHEFEGGLDWQRDGISVREKGYSTDLMGAEAVRILENRDKEKPLFLYLSFNAPHFPLQAPEDLIQKYAGVEDENRRVYCAKVEAMDRAIGRVLDALEEQGMDRETLVIFLSDNGASQVQGGSNGSLHSGKFTVYEGGIRVPAILRWPGRIPAGRVSEQLTILMDILPTLASVAHFTPQEDRPLDGVDILPFLQEERTERRKPFLFAQQKVVKTLEALLDWPWKLLKRISREDRSAETYLFRLDQDPSEEDDLAGANKDRVKQYEKILDDWVPYDPHQPWHFGGRPPAWFPPKDWTRIPGN